MALAGAVCLITIAGAVTGARFKTESDAAAAVVVKPRSDELREQMSLADEQIAVLQSRRAALLGLRISLEQKVAVLRERMKKKESEGRA